MNSFEVDSFKIRIPFEQVEILNPSIEGSWIVINTKTGEVDPYAYKNNSYRIDESGIKTKFAIESMRLSAGAIQTFITILVNSKTLKGKYLEGITNKNIKMVYKYLISLNVVKFSFEDFINSEITDVDFKKDIIKANVNQIISALYLVTRDTSKNITRKFLRKDNKGIEWSKRDNTDISKPFLKMYQKGIELKNHSKEFFEAYLTGKDFDNLDNMFRIEFTAKNKKFFKKYGIEDTSLNSILNISNETKHKMLIDISKNHLDIYEVKPMKIKTKLTANDTITLGLISMIIAAKLKTSETLIKEITYLIENRSQRSQKKSELILLYEKHLKPYMLGAEKEAKYREEILELLNA